MQIKEVLSQLLLYEGVCPSTSVYTAFVPDYEFKWGERIDKCEDNGKIVWALVDNEPPMAMESNCLNRRDIILNIGVTVNSEHEEDHDTASIFWNNIQSVFRHDGSSWEFDNGDITISTPSPITITAPFSRYNLGITEARAFRGPRPRKIGCTTVYEMLVQVSIYFRVLKNRKFITKI